MKEAEGALVSIDSALQMSLAKGKNQQVVGQAAGNDIHGSHAPAPGREEEGDQHHTPWATLRDAAGVQVGLPQAPS